MELSQLQQFMVVAKTENMTEASKKLFISQPNVSRSIRNLEDELNFNLFDRVKGRLILNANGQNVLESAERIFNEIEGIKNIDSITKNAPIKINIGGLGSIYFETMIPRMLSELTNYKIFATTFSDKRKEEKALISNDIDIMFSSNSMFFSDVEIVNQFFITEHLCASIPKDNPLAKHESIKLNDLEGKKFISSAHDDAMILSRMLKRNNIKIITDFNTNQPVSGSRYMYSEQLIFDSILNKYYTTEESNRVCVPIENKDAIYPIYLTYKKENENRVKNIIDWMIDFGKCVIDSGQI